jgi:hypothetical protein
MSAGIHRCAGGRADDVLDRNSPGAQNLEVAFDQHKRFTGARPGGDGQVPIERMSGSLLLGLERAGR